MPQWGIPGRTKIQQRVVKFGEWLCTHVLRPVPHRHFVLIMPKILTRFFLRLSITGTVKNPDIQYGEGLSRRRQVKITPKGRGQSLLHCCSYFPLSYCCPQALFRRSTSLVVRHERALSYISVQMEVGGAVHEMREGPSEPACRGRL